jgi:hypothetical protein
VRPSWLARIFLALALIGCAFAFVGLTTGGYWTDELFSLYIVDHHGGPAEVVRRTLTDTHPPAYYLLLYGWTRIFGLGEAATRSLSVLFSIGAVAIFGLGTGKALTPAARAFASACAVGSGFWFFQAQNDRNYGLAMFALAALLALALQESAADRKESPWRLAGLLAAGFLASLTHFYAFLGTGAVFAMLVLTVRGMGRKAIFAAEGAAILAVELVYIHVLVGHTKQNLHQMWFSNDPGFIANELLHAFTSGLGPGSVAAAILLAGFALWRRERPAVGPDQAGWLAAAAALGLFALIAGGLAVSLLFAPSFSDINVLTGSPFIWALLGVLYDRGAPREGEPKAWMLATALAALIGLQLAAMLPERFSIHTEQWRETARAVAQLPGCQGGEVPAVAPSRFAAPTPFYLELFRREFFGRYLAGGSDRIQAYPVDAFGGAKADGRLRALLSARVHGQDPCPLLAWAAHDMKPDGAAQLAAAIAGATGVDANRIEVRTFYDRKLLWLGERRRASAFLILARPAGVRPGA